MSYPLINLSYIIKQSLKELLLEPKYQSLNDPNLKLSDYGTYIKITINDQNSQPITQILTTLFDLQNHK